MSSKMWKTQIALASLGVVLSVGCGGGGHAKSPVGMAKLAQPVAAAFKEEATGDPIKAVDLWIDALDVAAQSPSDTASVAIALASLDALVHRDVAAFSDIARSSALVDRIDPNALAKAGGAMDARLAKVQAHAEGPFVRPLVARGRLALAERRGDTNAATALRADTGCVREATVLAPVSWTPVSGVDQPSALDRADAPLPQDVPGPGPFTTSVKPVVTKALGCHLPLYAETNMNGVREVVVDVEVPKSGIIGVGLRTDDAATLRVGGKIAITRPHSAGGPGVARFARVQVDGAGTLRLVARIGMDEDFATFELGAWDEDGRPLKAHAPAPGSKANVSANSAVMFALGTPKTVDEKLAVALGALAARESHAAESLLEADIAQPNTPPELLMTYGRAVRMARDLPMVKATERARGAYDRVLEAWPSSWEAVVEHAVLAGVRRARTEARIEALADLDTTLAKSKTVSSPALVSAFEAATAGGEQLYDRANTALQKARAGIPNTPLLFDVTRLVGERTGKELVAFECDEHAPTDRSSLACHYALLSTGDRAGAERELERLRALLASPQLYLSLSTKNALETGDLARAARIYDDMNAGDRQLSTLYAVKGKGGVPDLLKLAVVARDSPSALPGVLRAAGDDPIAGWDGIAEKVTSDEKGGALLTNAATAILAHEEKYDVQPSGLVHFTLLDVRRVMGTTDVESNAQAGAPMLYGRDTMRILRRRIFKKDGRILLPDRTPNASQSHADLSQLEAGDAVEAIYEGWALPAEMGNIGIDTPDLLPERTAVRSARIELRLPQGLKSSLWSHPMLGKAEERTDQGKRVLTWTMKDRAVRRLEYGVPKMDRSVGVSFSTTTWADVAKGLRETVASLDSTDPEVTKWAHEAAAGKSPSRELVEAVVAASGKAVMEASGNILADIDLGRGGQNVTARTILATHEGSRTWLVVRALHELGVKADVVVAENEPFSDSPNFPPHFGRFMHPLAVAHVPDAGKTTDVWIDADIPGPPLPAGRISPELRGRNALWQDGRIEPLPAVASNEERDEIDQRLTVDDQGNAKGVLTVLLRGRASQDLAEALVRLVGAERQRALRGIALGWMPFATVEKVELSSSEGSWQIAIRAELSAPAYAQVEGQKPGNRAWILPGIDPVHYVFPRPFSSTLAASYASQASRENALAINRATQYHVRRRVELPPKAQIVRLPGPFEGKGPLFSASRKINVTGNNIEEDFSLEVTTGTVPRERYDDFVNAAHRTDDAFRASTRVKPPAP